MGGRPALNAEKMVSGFPSHVLSVSGEAAVPTARALDEMSKWVSLLRRRRLRLLWLLGLLLDGRSHGPSSGSRFLDCWVCY